LGQFEPTTLLAIAIATAFVTVVAYRRVRLNLKRRQYQLKHGCQPPPSFRWVNSLFGLAQYSGRRKAAKENRLLKFASGNFQTLGPTWRSNVFGQEVILTIQPENIKTILSLRFKEYGLGNREHTLGPLLGRGIFTSDGESWAHSRAMIRPNFARDQVADLASLERHVQALFRLLPRDDPSKVVDLQERFFQLTIDTATEFLFGQSTNTLEAAAKEGFDASDDFANDFTVAQRWCAQRGRVGMLRPIHSLFGGGAGPRAIKKCHAFVDRFVDEAVRYREKVAAGEEKKIPDEEEGHGEKRKYVFLHELARSTDDKRRLRDELLNVLLAGRDTTASLMSNMWFCIAKQPEIFAKLRREVDEKLGGELPTYEQLKDLKYLRWCMNESLRIHPVVPGNSRLAYQDTILPTGGGPDGTAPVFVAKGTIVIYWAYAMHRRRDFYGADADEFRPERWETLRPGWEYLPFNGGPRICLGQQYALTEAAYVSVRLLQEFSKIESMDPEDWAESLTLTLCSHNGTKVSLTKA
jgi:cytochrome P450